MKYCSSFILGLLFSAPVYADEMQMSDLPPSALVEKALNSHANVLAAEREVLIARAARRKWKSGNYEFNLRAGSSQREISTTGQRQREWDVALERPLRLFNKVMLDSDIGSESLTRAEFALGDARHEAGRLLLHLWFNWQREQTQVELWQQQAAILQQQVLMTEKRMHAGDASKMELNQIKAEASLAEVSMQQARLRAALAASELKRPFPDLPVPANPVPAAPQAIEHDLNYWQNRVMEDNHELGMIQADSRVQELLAQRQRAERVPDPTVGVRYSSEKEGEEKVAGVYVSLPLSFGLRAANADIAQQQAEIAHAREITTQRRLEGDVYADYTQACDNFLIWQQARTASLRVHENADLVTHAYSLGESSLTDVLNARRLALESGLAANISQLEANEARYRLLLNAHLLWSTGEH